MSKPEPKKIGRPSNFTPEIGDKICALITDGISLNKICQMDEFPALKVVYSWLRNNEAFSNNYARAKQEQADTYTDKITDIAMDTLSGKYEPNNARIAIDALKWTASKLKPKAYGDRQVIDVTGNVTHASLSDDDLSRRLLELRTAHEIASKT